MLHHIINPEEGFGSLKTVLKKDGKAIVVDLCEHNLKSLRQKWETSTWTSSLKISLRWRKSISQRLKSRNFWESVANTRGERQKSSWLPCEIAGKFGLYNLYMDKRQWE
jgi:hypothetical protein